MAATTIHGHRAKVVHGATTFSEPMNWSISATIDIFDATVLHASNVAKGKVTGFTDFTATVEAMGEAVGGPEITEGDEGTLVLSMTDGTVANGAFSGNAICTGITVTQDPSGAGKFSYAFQGSGVLDWVTA